MLKYYHVVVEPLKTGKFYQDDLKRVESFDTLEEAEKFYNDCLLKYRRGLFTTKPYLMNWKDNDYIIDPNNYIVEFRWASFNGEKVVEARYIGYPWNKKNPWLFRVSEEKRQYWKYMNRFKVYRSNVSIG